MHIGIDCRLPTYRMGGISQYTIYLIQALGQLVGEERYTIFHKQGETRSFLPNSNQRFSRSDLWTPCHHALERYALAVELRRHKLDVYHSPDFIPPILGRARRVITVHDLTFLYYPQFLTAESRRYYSDQIEWAVAAADHIIADSHASRADLIRLLGVAPDEVTAIHLAANPVFNADYDESAIEQTLQEYNLGHGFILTVGTLEPRKNLETLVNVYHRLRQEKGVTVPLVLVGGRGWNDAAIFQAIDKLGLGPYVMHLSRVPDIHLAHLYHAAGVLAFPSHYEGFGLPALEAMLCDCPVVASNRGSLPEVVGDAALTLEPDDVDGWVEGLHNLLEDPRQAEAMRQAGRIQAKKFSWAQTAAATLAIYRGERG